MAADRENMRTRGEVEGAVGFCAQMNCPPHVKASVNDLLLRSEVNNARLLTNGHTAYYPQNDSRHVVTNGGEAGIPGSLVTQTRGSVADTGELSVAVPPEADIDDLSFLPLAEGRTSPISNFQFKHIYSP